VQFMQPESESATEPVRMIRNEVLASSLPDKIEVLVLLENISEIVMRVRGQEREILLALESAIP
jgi:hypothetical protein